MASPAKRHKRMVSKIKKRQRSRNKRIKRKKRHRSLMVVIRKNIDALARLIVAYLEANGIGMFGVDLFIQAMPESPVLATVVVMTGGPVLPEDPTRRPSFSIQHRTTHVESGLPKSVEIHNLFDNQWNVLKGFPGRTVSVSEAGASFKDKTGASVFPLNFAFTSTTQT